ncbi:MAG: Arc family DNA-binding protein [Proteobacteria bacterium]|nr:Arc family DNA-binding protein [Pseudomonadota bacterium]
MGVNLSIKNVPAEKVELLKQRAKRNHRSLQGELLAIVDQAIETGDRTITLRELAARAREIGLSTPDESTHWIRELRDSR